MLLVLPTTSIVSLAEEMSCLLLFPKVLVEMVVIKAMGTILKS